MRRCCCLLVFLNSGVGLLGEIFIDIDHAVADQPLMLESLRYTTQGEELFSITRLSYLLSEFSLKTKEGEWIRFQDRFAWVDVGKRRSRLALGKAPAGEFVSLRFKVGLEKEVNHSDPSQYPARHALNANLNQLHWDWQGGYIFLAIEGRWRSLVKDSGKKISGFVYHFANDPQLTTIELPINVVIDQYTQEVGIKLKFDASKLFKGKQTISFGKEGNSTHSRSGDPIALALKENLPLSFSLAGVRFLESRIRKNEKRPIDMPDRFTAYAFQLSPGMPIPELPQDNPLIVERVNLGKQLFFDPLLSDNGEVSCASCHLPEKGFSDPKRFSRGLHGFETRRHSMPLFNLAWKSELFWDGRVESLREQFIHPLSDAIEMDRDLDELCHDLANTIPYPGAFRAAFKSGAINIENITLALENYLLTITSQDSKFDKALRGEGELSELEREGFALFMTENEPRSGMRGADCFHCHGGALFSDHSFHDNGLPLSVEEALSDRGRAEATGDLKDNYKFATPSLRNLVYTAPYMHDGRFTTLEAVVDHYNNGFERRGTLDANLAKHPESGLGLSEHEKKALVAFLKSLSDEQAFINLEE